MPGQRGSENRQRQHMFTIRLDDVELRHLDQVAKYSGRTKADVIRRFLAHDHSRILPSRELTQQILRVGRNVNQIATALNGINAQAETGKASTHVLDALHQLQQVLASAVSDMVAIRRDMESWR